MTEHRRITPPGRGEDKRTDAKADGTSRRSLFERADETFGKGTLGPASVPRDLPETPRRAADPARSPDDQARSEAPGAETPAGSAPAAAPRRASAPVALSGPRQAVDRTRLREEGLIVPEEPATGQLEEFRIVKRDLLADARGGDDLARRILLCSPHPGEGKTYCATNLAIAMAAERDIEVVLIDADVVKPSITHRLGIDGGTGLMDVLADPSIKPETCVIRTDIEGLFVLPAGRANRSDAEYLASARTGDVLDRLMRGAPNRVLIFDTPPALAASPAAELAGHVGQALLVARADETGRAALEDAQQLLSACPEIKLLLNAARYSPSGRRFGDYGKGRD